MLYVRRIAYMVIALCFLVGGAACKTTSEFTLKTKTIDPDPEIAFTITMERVFK